MNILCKNTRVEKFQKVECRRYLGSVPECVVESLKANPGQAIKLRCPTCPPSQRFIKVFYDNANKLTWESTSETPSGNELQYDNMVISDQVG